MRSVPAEKIRGVTFMPIYNSNLHPDGLMKEIHSKYSGICAYDKNSQGKYLQLVLSSGQWACEKERQKMLRERLEGFAFSAGQEVFFPHCSQLEDLLAECEKKLDSKYNGNWDHVLISIVTSMTDADTDPSSALSLLNMATGLKKYLGDNYVFECSVVFYGVFTEAKKIACHELRGRLAKLQSSGILRQIFHIVNDGSEIRPLQTIAFSSAILPFCMDAKDINSPLFKFYQIINGNKDGTTNPAEGGYSFKLIDSLLLNVQEAAAIKYSYDILKGQKDEDGKESSWDKALEKFAQSKILSPLADADGTDPDTALSNIQKRIMDETGLLPVLPQKEAKCSVFSLFPKKKQNLIMELPEEINTGFYGKLPDGRSTLEHFIENELAELRRKLDAYSDDEFCRALVHSCPSIKFARSIVFTDALKKTAEKDFDSLFKSADPSKELEANVSPFEILKKKSLYCRDYYITKELNRFFSEYLKERLSRAAKKLSNEQDKTVNGISDRLAEEMLDLGIGWKDYMGTEIEQAKPIVSVPQYDDPMEGICDKVFTEKVMGMPNDMEEAISSAFLKRAEDRITHTQIVAAAGTAVKAGIFIHNTDFSAGKINVYDFHNDSVFYQMIAAFSVRFFSATDNISYYK